MMFTALFGNASAEKVLLYMANYQEGYANGIADTFAIPLNMVQRQLLKFEAEGILASQLKGRTRVFLWNPRYPFLKELKALLEKGLELMPEAGRKKYFMQRRRPRRTGKPL